MARSFVHVDVFAAAPYSGNSLAVFPDARGLDADQMLRITQELRHFEAIFLEPTPKEDVYRARVFDLLQELPFAGHPLIGAAAVLHRRTGVEAVRHWRIELPAKTVAVSTERAGTQILGGLAQGSAEFLGVVEDRKPIAEALNLTPTDLIADLPLEVVSTGLRYLVVPVVAGVLERARIVSDLTRTLQMHGAQFAVLLDEAAREQRHWNNDGVMEDVATGSAAGVIGAYRLRHGLTPSGQRFDLHQGRFTGRPSVLQVTPTRTELGGIEVQVSGRVSFVGQGELEVLPV